MMVALLALALGAYAGATTADQNARRAAVARTHLVLWASMGDEIRPPVDGMMQLPTKILSIGGPVLLHGVRTRFGTATLQADQPLDSTARVVYLPVKVDCSLAGRWRSDPRSVDYTGTAVVRDEAGSPTREVPVDLTGEFVVAILFSACEQARDPVASSDTAASSDGTSADGTSPDGGVPGAVVTFTQMLSDDRGGLQYTAELDAGSPIAVQVDTPVLALIAGTGPGKFRESTTPPLPHTLKPGQKVTVQVQLTYVCTNGKQVLPWTTTIVEPVLTSTTGSAGYRGWDASLVGVAVRGAIAQAGCSPPDDGESLIVQ